MLVKLNDLVSYLIWWQYIVFMWYLHTYVHVYVLFMCLQTERVYVMDVNVMTKICNGNFYYDKKDEVNNTSNFS